LAKFTGAQDGLFSRAQARQCGFSQYQIRRRLETGEWQAVLGDIYALGGARVTPRLRDLAAHLAVPGAVLGGPSAARWHGMALGNVGTYVLVGRRHRVRLAGVEVIHDRINAADIWLLDNVYVTAPSRTVLDCLRVLPDPVAGEMLDRALRAGWTSLDDIGARVRSLAGRHGAPRLVRIVGAAAANARSASERLAVSLLRKAGIWGWLPNEPIADRWGVVAIGDIVFPRVRLLIELDGTFDRVRHNRLAAAGWTVLRLTWYELVARPEWVVATVRQALGRLGATGVGR
jgi:hypothetical protein